MAARRCHSIRMRACQGAGSLPRVSTVVGSSRARKDSRRRALGSSVGHCSPFFSTPCSERSAGFSWQCSIVWRSAERSA